MSQIKAFNGIHYNPEKITDFGKVVCPPYDVISRDQQNRYHNLSPYNFIHIDFGKETPRDDEDNNKYTRAKTIFENWLREGVLVQDSGPAIYFYKQEYKIMGEQHSRSGFIALMKLQDDGDSTIFPHENTHAEAKEDRLRLTSAIKANLSPIFVCFSDKKRKVEHIFSKHLLVKPPLLDVIDEDRVRHRLWILDEPDLIREVEEAADDQPMFIADGHHRYEVAQQYRRLRSKNKSKDDEPSSFDYVMTYFTNIESKDLQIFPIHRVIKKLHGSLDFLEENFRIDKLKSKTDLAILLGKAGRNENAFGLYMKDNIRLLRLKNKMLIDKMIPEGSLNYKQLDATILKHFVFDSLKIASQDITYIKDVHEAIRMVDAHEADASFILNPVQIQQLKSIALNGERMPPKTTYFYPKVLSGLTVYKLE